MRYVILALLIVSSTFRIDAQTKRPLTMEEAVLGLSQKLAPTTITSIHWIPEADKFSCIKSSEPTKLLLYNAADGKKIDEIDVKDISAEITKASQLSALQWKDLNSFLYIFNSKVFEYNTKKKSNNYLYELPADAQDIFFSPDLKSVCFTTASILGYATLGSEDKPTIIAENKGLDEVYGQSVSRNEYGITKGIFYSPKSNFIAYYKKDQKAVKDYPIINWEPVPAYNENIKYPMAGGPSETVYLYIYNPKTNKSLQVSVDNSHNNYVTCITWSPDEKYIYATILNRATTKASVNKYSASTGEFIKTMIFESDDKWVEPQYPLYFENNEDFFYLSPRSGYNHIYEFKASTGELTQLTSGEWQVNDFLGYSPTSKKIYFTSSKDGPLDEHLYVYNMGNKQIQNLSKEPGWHSGFPSPSYKYMVDIYSSESVPSQTSLINLEKYKNKILSTSRNPLDSIQTSVITPVTIIADDGTPLYGKIMKPADMDPSKQYPTIVYLYNGPHVQLVKNRFPASGNLWYDYLTSHGYVVFVMDGRGSANRGKAFEQAIYQHLGQVEMADQLKGIQFLKLQSFVDRSRMGMHGWSFGGFMTTSFMLKQPDIFKAAVAGGPVIDWSMYEVMYTERYMDTPEENPEGYFQSNLLDKTNNLKGKLLVIHGTQDDVVVWQQSIKFIKECVSNDMQVDYFVYPGHPHNVRGKDRVHLMQKVTDYFDLYLKPEQ